MNFILIYPEVGAEQGQHALNQLAVFFFSIDSLLSLAGPQDQSGLSPVLKRLGWLEPPAIQPQDTHTPSIPLR